jgi:hypothetical protein
MADIPAKIASFLPTPTNPTPPTVAQIEQKRRIKPGY